MTREEINILQDIVDLYEKEDMYPLLKDKQIRTIKMAIHALEQEPCDDAISREWIKTAIHNIYYGLMHTPTEEDIQAYLDVAPSVQPKTEQEPKTGHWIGIDEEPHEVWECDHCGFVIDGSGCIDPYDYRDTYKFCPNCGAGMTEEQERSE